MTEEKKHLADIVLDAARDTRRLEAKAALSRSTDAVTEAVDIHRREAAAAGEYRAAVIAEMRRQTAAAEETARALVAICRFLATCGVERADTEKVP